MAGSYTIVAIEYTNLPGNDYPSKTAAFEKMTFNEAKACAGQHGFWVTMKADTVGVFVT